MDKYNLIIIGFVVATAILTLWWAFNTIRRIDNQKNYCAVQLTSIAKLWHKAKFVPEDAKERESLYLYRDFLRKFDEGDGQYPVMVKDGKVRCMTRKEYDNLVGQKDAHAISPLITIISLILAVGSICVNMFLTKTPLIGLGLAAVMPVLQLILAFFVHRFNKEKNNYRDGIFLALKENSVSFLTITKPFIIVDAYPDKFGKNKKPLYATIGELPEAQIIEVRDFIIRQKAAETKVVLNSVDNEREIIRLTEKTTKQPDLVNASEVVQQAEPVDEEEPNVMEEPTPVTEPAPVPEAPAGEEDDDLLEIDKINLINDFVDDMMLGEVQRAVKKAKKAEQTAEPVTPMPEVAPIPTAAEAVAAPAEDDFSLEAIGQALDAEIARRNKKGRWDETAQCGSFLFWKDNWIKLNWIQLTFGNKTGILIVEVLQHNTKEVKICKQLIVKILKVR